MRKVRTVAHVARVAHKARHRAVERIERTVARRAPVIRSASRGIERVVDFAEAQLGENYVSGGTGGGGWDCSGLTKAAFRLIGVDLPHSSYGQAGRGRYVPASQRRRGDLMVWPGHVGIYLGGGRMISAANHADGVKTQGVWGSPEYRRL